jgi:hypothetical protein
MISFAKVEVVLTFEDGLWPKNTQAVLAALAAHCPKAIFFPIGLHATYEPGMSRSMAASAVACWKSCISTMPLPCVAVFGAIFLQKTSRPPCSAMLSSCSR